MVKPIEERIEQLRTQLELWNENLTIQLKQEKDKYEKHDVPAHNFVVR